MTSKKAVSNYLLSSSKRLKLPNLFLHSETNLKDLVEKDFLLYLILFFTLKPTEKKARNISNIRH